MDERYRKQQVEERREGREEEGEGGGRGYLYCRQPNGRDLARRRVNRWKVGRYVPLTRRVGGASPDREREG